MATFTGQAATNNTFTGTAAADTFLWAAADLNNLDHATGGGGSDLLKLTSAGALAGAALTGLSGIERYQLAAGGNAITLTNANFTGVTGAKILIKGGAGNDTVNASALTGKNAIDVTAGAGLDSFTGGAGSDVFRFGAADLNGDTIAGGAGRDLLLLTSANTGAPVAGALAKMAGVETLQLAAGGNSIALVNAIFVGVAGARLLVHGGAGNDLVDGTALTGSNAIDVSAGAGVDVLRGGAGRDVFRFGGSDLAGDTIAGGAGRDLLLFTSGGVLGAVALASMNGVETIKLAKAGNSVTLIDANFAGVAGAKIVVTGGAGNDTVKGALLTGTNAIDVTAGAGADVLSGGAGRDTFRFKVADLAGDTVHGNGGLDQLLLADGGALAAGALAHVDGVETIYLAKAGNSLALTDANFTGVTGSKITVIGGAGSDRVDGGTLFSGNSIKVTAGGGIDTLIGGAGNDSFLFQAADLAGDTITGGHGTDSLVLTTAGALAANALGQMTGVETITLAAGGNSLTLTDANFAGVAGAIAVTGGKGNDTVDGSGLTGSNAIDATAGGGVDTLTGGAGDDVFRFGRTELTAADFVAGGTGFDKLVLTTAGVLAADALSHVTGIDRIDLAAGGNSITLTDANYAVPISGGPEILIEDFARSGSIDASGLTGNNSVYIGNGGGIETITTGAGSDTLEWFDQAAFGAGASFDGGGGTDQLEINGSIDLSGGTIRNVEHLHVHTLGGSSVTISGENAAGFTQMGSVFGFGGDDIFTVQLTADSITDLSNLTLVNNSGGDAINVVSASGNTAVTLSSGIARFTGSGDSDTVSLAADGHYRAGAVIDGGGGDDRIVFDAAAKTLEGGAGSDTLVLRNGETVDLSFVGGGTTIGTTSVLDFENIDASLSAAAVTLYGRGDLASVLIGSSGDDHIFAGNSGSTITGGLGADTLTGGAGDDRFHIQSTAEAQGDIINGSGGSNGIDVLGDTDFSFTQIDNIQTLYLAAGDAAGNIINADLTATVTGSQALGLHEIFGNGYFTTTETLVVNADATTLDLSNLNFYYWGAEDHVAINGTGGGDAIIGTSQNDVIDGGGGDDVLSGGDGNDVIGFYLTGQQALAGGTGDDTLRLSDNTLFNEVNYNLTVNLDSNSISVDAPDIAFSNPITATGFENVDLSANFQKTVMIGSAEANTLIGGFDADTITGGLGADTLTGGGGADSFVWNNKIEGGDTITDFAQGTDKLVFSAAAFGFTGASFDTITYDNNAGLPLESTDLYVASPPLNTGEEVRAYFDIVGPGSDRPMFVLTGDSMGHTVLYYSPDASAADPGNPGADHAFYRIADLGFSPISAFTLNDFVFI